MRRRGTSSELKSAYGVTWSGGSSFGPVPLYQDALAQERGIVGMAGYGMDSDEIRLFVNLFL